MRLLIEQVANGYVVESSKGRYIFRTITDVCSYIKGEDSAVRIESFTGCVSMRTINIILEQGITTIDELKEVRPGEASRWHGIGVKGLKEIDYMIMNADKLIQH